ncbi:MAG: leucine-rich repeat protein, partial [bacterium]
DSTLGHARLPWTDAIEGYTDEKEDESGTKMTIRRIAAVRVGGGITRLGEWLLGGIVGIGIPISLPDSLREIGSLAFYGTNIEGELVIPDSVVRINAAGLKGANAEVVVLGSRAALTPDTFSGFRVPEVGGKDTALIELSGQNPYLETVDGVLYTKELDRLIAFPSASNAREYEVLEGAKTVGAFAFCGCTLECLTLPESMEVLEKDAFVGCSFREMLVKSSLTKVDESLSGDDAGIASRYEGIFFYRDAPKGQLIGTGTRAFIYIPQGNKTWSKALRRTWKAGANKREVTFILWKPGEKLENTITAEDVVVNARDELTSYVPLKAKAKAGTLTCVSEIPQITVSSDAGSLITIPPRYTGQSTIQLISEENRAYKSTTKVIRLIVNPNPNLIFGSDIHMTYSADQDQTALLDFTWYGAAKGQYVSSDSNVTVAPDGLVTVKKGFSGTAEITVNVPADGAYMAASATIKVIVSRW